MVGEMGGLGTAKLVHVGFWFQPFFLKCEQNRQTRQVIRTTERWPKIARGGRMRLIMWAGDN